MVACAFSGEGVPVGPSCRSGWGWSTHGPDELLGQGVTDAERWQGHRRLQRQSRRRHPYELGGLGETVARQRERSPRARDRSRHAWSSLRSLGLPSSLLAEADPRRNLRPLGSLSPFGTPGNGIPFLTSGLVPRPTWSLPRRFVLQPAKGVTDPGESEQARRIDVGDRIVGDDRFVVPGRRLIVRMIVSCSGAYEGSAERGEGSLRSVHERFPRRAMRWKGAEDGWSPHSNV